MSPSVEAQLVALRAGSKTTRKVVWSPETVFYSSSSMRVCLRVEPVAHPGLRWGGLFVVHARALTVLVGLITLLGATGRGWALDPGKALPQFAQYPGSAAVDSPPIHGGRGIVGHVLESQYIRGKRPAERSPQGNGARGDGSSNLKGALPGLLPGMCRVVALFRGRGHSDSAPGSGYCLATWRAKPRAALMAASSLACPIPRAIPAA